VRLARRTPRPQARVPAFAAAGRESLRISTLHRNTICDIVSTLTNITRP